jgi:hypothetical protein
MSQRYNASIDVTKLVNTLNLQGGHSAFKVGKNGSMYASVTLWMNDEPDQFGNVISFQLNSTQAGQAADLAKTGGKPVYIGNGKPPKDQANQPANGAGLQMNTAQYGAPGAQATQQNTTPWNQTQNPAQDLPF